MAWEKTTYIDSWNWYKSTISSTEDVKNNKSSVTVTGQLHIVRNGSLRSDYGTTITAHTESKYLGSPLYGENNWYVSKTFDVPHDANGKAENVWIDSTCSGGWGYVSAGQTITFPQIDRNGITISNYTLRECDQRKLSINFKFNYDPANTWYRYKKATASDWETDWIEWDTYGGSYNSSTKEGYFITPKLKANTEYVIEIKAKRSYNDVVTSKSANFFVESSIYIKKNDSWIDGEVYIKKNGSWKKGIVYIKKNGVWKEAG